MFVLAMSMQEVKLTSIRFSESKGHSVDTGLESEKLHIGCYNASVQELIVIDDLPSALVGIEGRYISINRVKRGNEDSFTFNVDGSMDLALQESSKRIFPLCKSYLVINQFVESRSQFKSGLDCQAMVAQLEHQFRLGRLSLQGLWFYCQPMMGSMQALSTAIRKASASNSVGSAVLNLFTEPGKGNGW